MGRNGGGGGGVSEELQIIFESARAHQHATLYKILSDNVGCAYLSGRHGFDAQKMLYADDIKNTFLETIPICDYEDLKDYIEGIADGDQSPILCNYPVNCFSISSGTTAGKSKEFPCTTLYEEIFHKSSGHIETMAKRLGEQEFRERNVRLEKPKVLSLAVAGKQFKTQGGHVVGSALTNYYRGKDYRNSYSEKNYCSPIEVVLSEDGPLAIYCHLLCGLLNAKDVWCIDAGFSFNMDSALGLLTASWQQLCSDIRHGKLNPKITDPNVRKAIATKLKADPELADEIEKECGQASSSSWEGIVRKLWPNAVMILCRGSGPTLKLYLRRISFYSGNLPLYAISYGVSEGGHVAVAISLQRNPADEALYSFLPNVAFFEFIPLKDVSNAHSEDGDEQILGGSNFVKLFEDMNKTVGFEGVKIGQYYQPVVTTFQGLYRYKLSDVIRIKGFQGQSPTFEFICRKNAILSLNTDKTDEAELQMVIEKADVFLKQHGLTILDYTSSVDVSCSPGRYVIFLEFLKNKQQQQTEAEEEEQKGKEMAALQECCTLMDGSFSHAYKLGRKLGKIGALQLCVVKSGTFRVLLEERLGKGTCISQYKPPRALPWESYTISNTIKPRVLKSYSSRMNNWTVYS